MTKVHLDFTAKEMRKNTGEIGTVLACVSLCVSIVIIGAESIELAKKEEEETGPR